MDTLLLLLFSILAYDRRIHQEYIFYTVKSRNIRCRKKGGKQGMEYFTQERRRLEKRLRQAVSEITEIPRAQAAAARIRKEKLELA